MECSENGLRLGGGKKMGLQTALWLLAIPIAYGRKKENGGGREEKGKGKKATCKFGVPMPTSRSGKIPFIIIIVVVK